MRKIHCTTILYTNLTVCSIFQEQCKFERFYCSPSTVEECLQLWKYNNAIIHKCLINLCLLRISKSNIWLFINTNTKKEEVTSTGDNEEFIIPQVETILQTRSPLHFGQLCSSWTAKHTRQASHVMVTRQICSLASLCCS